MAATRRPGVLNFYQDWGTSAGLFIGRKRIAWWPAALPIPSKTEAEMVLENYHESGEVLGHEEVFALMNPNDEEFNG